MSGCNSATRLTMGMNRLSGLSASAPVACKRRSTQRSEPRPPPPRRHGRACPGHPRLTIRTKKTWMPGTRPGMTAKGWKPKMPRRLEGDFDYIVVGAGTAGCIMANRLSADPKNRVLILEAGGNDNWIWFHIPVGYLFAIGNPRSDWMFKTEPEPGLNGRALAYPRGKVIGGSSAINAMISMRGQAADYDHWRQLGLTGWG